MRESALRKILSEVLGRDAVDIDADFFELGGSSLRALEVSRRIGDELGLTLELIDVFQNPSVRKLGALLQARAASPGTRPPAPLPQAESYRVSAIQRSLFMLDRMCEPRDRIAVPFVFGLEHNLVPELAEAAFHRVRDRHEVLRTTFSIEADSPVQRVFPRSTDQSGFACTDLRSAAENERSLQEVFDAASADPFDLEQGPVARLHVVDIADGFAVAMLSLHHIVSDAFSASSFEHDFRCAYDELSGTELLARQRPPPPTLSFHYKDYVPWLDAWIGGRHGERAREFWSNAFARPTPLPFGKSPDLSFATATVEVPLDELTLGILRRSSEELEVTLFIVLQAVIRVLLLQVTGEASVVLGVAVTTRDTLALSGHIGPFVNTLPVPFELDSKSSFAAAVAAIDQAMLAAHAHKLLPVESIAAHVTDGAPLFDVGLTMQPGPALHTDPRVAIALPPRTDPLAISLLFAAYERDLDLGLQIRYRTARFSHAEVIDLAGELVRIIGALDGRSGAPLKDVLGASPVIELDLGDV